MKKLIILQAALPDYRKKLFLYIKKELGGCFELYGGDCYFEKSVKTDQTIVFKNSVKNIYLFNRRFLFQFGMWSIVLKNNVLVMELNPRILSNWIILILRKVFNRKTILWGHAWPRNGKDSKSDIIRNFMRAMADEIIVYTKTQRKELIQRMPHKKIRVAPNAVFYKDEMITNQNSEIIKNIIYVGRLTKSKKALFLTRAFHKIMMDLPSNANLIVVGNGEEKGLIENYVKLHSLDDRIRILGHIGKYEKLKELYESSLVSASPGYIGLSVTQSFGFGVPMIVSKTETHSPEIEAVIETENAIYFETDDLESLSQTIVSFYDSKNEWIIKRKSIVDFCKENYTTEVMAASFITLLSDKAI